MKLSVGKFLVSLIGGAGLGAAIGLWIFLTHPPGLSPDTPNSLAGGAQVLVFAAFYLIVGGAAGAIACSAFTGFTKKRCWPAFLGLLIYPAALIWMITFWLGINHEVQRDMASAHVSPADQLQVQKELGPLVYPGALVEAPHTYDINTGPTIRLWINTDPAHVISYYASVAPGGTTRLFNTQFPTLGNQYVTMATLPDGRTPEIYVNPPPQIDRILAGDNKDERKMTEVTIIFPSTSIGASRASPSSVGSAQSAFSNAPGVRADASGTAPAVTTGSSSSPVTPPSQPAASSGGPDELVAMRAKAASDLPALLGPLLYPGADILFAKTPPNGTAYPFVSLVSTDSLPTVSDYYVHHFPGGSSTSSGYAVDCKRPGDNHAITLQTMSCPGIGQEGKTLIRMTVAPS